MKKIIYLVIWSFIFAWCSIQKTTENTDNQVMINSDIDITCSKDFIVWIQTEQNLSLKAKVISANIKNIVSNNAWIVSFLNCENWKVVNSKTLIATIKPDWSDPNIQNLLNQKTSLQNQITNLQNIISSTKSDFSLQFQSLNNQKTSIENQIGLLENSLKQLDNQTIYGINDLKSQVNTLQTQLEDLKTSKATLEKTKNADLEKLDKNIKNNILQAENLSKDVLLKIDEIYWITDKNNNKNNSFEDYLSAKNISLKNKIKNEFIKLNNNLPTNYDWWSLYIWQLDDFIKIVQESIKDSVPSSAFTENQIDSFYNMFVQYDNNLIILKNALDTLINNLETVKNNYDNQIINLQTQINNISNQIANINQNKLNSYTSNLDIQTNQNKSQITNLKTNVDNIISQINSLQEKEKIQINQLENQLNQLKTSLNQININLQEQNIYANVIWKIKSKNVSVWNKIWPNSLLCQIIPDKAWLKIQVYTNKDLQIQDYILFKDGEKDCKAKIDLLLPYKDTLTLNNIYETENFAICNNKNIDISKIFSEWKIIDLNYTNNDNISKNIKIPLDFVINKITGNYVKKVLSWWKIETVKINLENIDWYYAEIWSWIMIGDKICR